MGWSVTFNLAGAVLSSYYDYLTIEGGWVLMAVKIQNQFGSIDIDNNVIASVVGGAATEVFGIVGMASKNQIRDNLNEILKRDNFAKGVVVRQDGDKIAVDVYIIVGYGTKISEVCRNVQNKVKYNLESMLGITADAVNVIVQGVRVIDAETERR